MEDAVIAPAGWLGRAIKLLHEPSIHQFGTMLNPPERTWLLLPIFIAFHYHIHSHSQSHSVFSLLMRKTASNTQPKYFFLPGVVDRDGVETVLFWPLILSHAIFLLKHSRTQSCVSFCIFAPSSMNHQWSTSRGKNLFLFFHTFDGEGGGGCNKNSPLHRWELLSQFYSFFVNGK